ncbi:hypothetical protein llap_18669 [Limosa lapponica baueri]|uniref:NuBaID C-terminal domain-containing protein n=1 Tax=Limosa lapponica baueri TaxID=1758121 RepID=A0A2I0TB58_LIMLA|nr:hypothetical protein llap_18669 [Limosa lapponica baueri]
MLKCSSCQAFLCVSLQLTFDFNKYRFAMLLVDEPRALLQDFLDRFQSLCQLELQLPSLRPEDMKNMHEKSPSPAISRPRGWDSPIPMDRSELEVASPTLRSRPVTRSMGQGDSMEVPSSPLRRAKRARLCSSSSSDTSLRSFFDPSSQHRDWCPWVNAVEGGEALEDATTQTEKEPVKAEPGWRVVLNTLLATRKCDRVPETEPVSLSVKSCKVFRIFRQWESMNSS